MKFLLSLLAIQTAAALAADAPAPKKDAELPPCCRPALPAGKPTDHSLYQLDSMWTSDAGRKVNLSVLRGRPQVVAMFFPTANTPARSS